MSVLDRARRVPAVKSTYPTQSNGRAGPLAIDVVVFRNCCGFLAPVGGVFRSGSGIFRGRAGANAGLEAGIRGQPRRLGDEVVPLGDARRAPRGVR